jgi:hypothetical protein
LNTNNSLDYKEFTGGLYGNTSLANKPEVEKKQARKYQDGSKYSYLNQDE